MAVYAIGDVQGCRESLERLLERINFDPVEDTLWFCGDLVNRGPDSLGALRFVRKLGDRTISVLGNHDLHLVASARASRPPREKDTFHDVLGAPDADELLDWLRRRPALHHDAELGYTLVHAGLVPQWDLDTAVACARELEAALAADDHAAFIDAMYGDQPDLWDDALTGIDRLRFIVNSFTRLRFVDADGRAVFHYKGAPGTQPAGLMPWFEHPGRRSRDLHIVFGHWSTLDRRGGGVYPLDSGCVWGGKLTALQLDGDGGWFSVECPQAKRPG